MASFFSRLASKLTGRAVKRVSRAATSTLPTEFGRFAIHVYENGGDGETHVALVCGELGDGEDVLTRLHSSCVTGDIFHSARCDCGPQLQAAMQRVSEEGRGVILYLSQEGRGIGLANKIRRTRSRTRASIRWKPTRCLASPPMGVITASAFRSCATSASARCACCPTIRANSPASPATA